MPSKELSDILITFKSASNVPIGDLIAQSSDCYLLACLKPRIPPSQEHPPFPLTFRTSTKRETRNPEWEESWHLGGIPAEGFELLIKIFDEDKPGDFDDRLGEAVYNVNQLPPTASDGKPGESKVEVLKIKKRKASRRAYAATYLVAWCHRDFKKQRGRVTISVQNLGKSTCTRNCPCVLGPMRWSIHTSPMMGRLAGTTSHPDDDRPTAQIAAKVKQTAQKASDKTKAKRDEHLNKGEHKTKTPHYAFEANKFQLLGTLPKDLRNKYVPYRPLIGFIFSGNGVRGWFLQRGLHAQHRRIYCYDKATKYGLVASPPAISKLEAGDVKNELSPHQKEEVKDEDEFAAARQFLEMVHFDEKPGKNIPGGRLYTYVITLQGEWRFTETGPEFAIQFLSKHSMHSDVSREIACAGEFFIRRRRHKGGMKLSDGHDDKKPEIDGQGERVEDSGKRSDSFEGAGYGSAGESEDKDKQQSEPKEEDKKHDEHKEEDENTETGSHDKDEISEGHGEAESSRQDSLQVSKKASHKAGGSRDPRNFVLIIDNDSGTYRPDSKSLPSLQKYLEQNLPGLKIKAMPCDSEQLKKWKEEQKPKKDVVKARRVEQQSSSSSSSSDQDV